MDAHRIFAMVGRYIKEYRHDWARVFSSFYWPVLEILLMGYTAQWLSDAQGLHVILMAVVLWQLVVRVNYDMLENLFLEVHNLNLTNLFTSPLTLSEWVVASIITGCIIQIGVTLVGSMVTYYFYGFNTFSLGLPGLLFFVSVMIPGWALGFFSCGFVMYHGRRARSFVYMIGWGFSLVSGIYFSSESLPPFLQYISKALPLIHTFDALRIYITTGTIVWNNILISWTLSLMYLALTIYFLHSMFKLSRQRGLSYLVS